MGLPMIFGKSKIGSMPSKKRLWTSWIIEGITVLFLLFDAGSHIVNPPVVAQGFQQLGYAPGLAPILGWVELACIVLYLIPRTSVLGAIFLTGYLGGAVATNVRVGAPFFTLVLAPVYVAVFVWGALWLRNERLRGLLS